MWKIKINKNSTEPINCEQMIVGEICEIVNSVTHKELAGYHVFRVGINLVLLEDPSRNWNIYYSDFTVKRLPKGTQFILESN